MPAPILFLADENVPVSVSQVFLDRGHEVWKAHEAVLPGTPDRILAALADEHGAVILTWDRRDFKALANLQYNGRYVFRRMGCISFKCKESDGVRRASEMMSRIEFEYAEVQSVPGGRLLMTIMTDSHTVNR